MRIEAPWFGDKPEFVRMAAVLDMTARQHCPNWAINVRHVGVNDLDAHSRARPSHIENTQKMEAWNAIVQGAENGERILLIDADTFIVNPIDDIWDRDFDLAYTDKDSRFPFNSGVVFVRVSPALKAFFSVWADVNRRMLTDNVAHAPWRRKYGGINQAAFGQVLKSKHADTINIVTIPCAEWNCEESAWAGFNPKTARIVHVKGAFRRALFQASPMDLKRQGVRNLIGVWTALESSMNGKAA